MTVNADETSPATAVVRVLSTWGDRTMAGTGVLVGRNDVLTAAHLVLWRGRLPDAVVVLPAEAAGGRGSGLAVARVETVTGFDPDDDGLVFSGDGLPRSRAGAERDIALLGLDRPIGDRLGALRPGDAPGEGVGAILGYPAAGAGRLVRKDAAFDRFGIDDAFDVAAFGPEPGMSGGPLIGVVGGQPRVLGLVSTGDAAVRVAAHRGWLREAMADNDRFLFDRAPSGRGPAATAEDAPAWFGAPRADRAGGAAGDRLTGGEDDDVLFGRGGGDLLEGLGGDDLLAGGAGPDTLSGGPGRDTLIGGDGRDRLLGGPGFDTAVYPGESGDYAVEAAGRGHRIVFAGGAAERLVEIERVLFADGGFILDA